jgi:hypothetical protein
VPAWIERQREKSYHMDAGPRAEEVEAMEIVEKAIEIQGTYRWKAASHS